MRRDSGGVSLGRKGGKWARDRSHEDIALRETVDIDYNRWLVVLDYDHDDVEGDRR